MHFRKGREHTRAVLHSSKSAEQSLGRGAYHEALDHLPRALESTARLPEGREKAETELGLLILLAAPLRMTRAFAAPEVERTYTRAVELCSSLNAIPQLFPILAPTGAAYVLRSSFGAALEVGQRFARLAEEHGDPAALSEARLVLGIAHHGRGEHRDAISHLAESSHPDQ